MIFYMLALLGYYKAMNKPVPLNICLAFFGIMAVPPVTTLYFFIEKHWVFQLIAFAVGWFCWTFIEYFANRFWLFRKENNNYHNFHYYSHLPHSIKLFIKAVKRLFITFLAISLLSSSILFSSYLFLPAGFFAGYAFYDYLDAWPRRPGVVKWFGQLHAFHHQQLYSHPGKCFGVTVTLWDRIFNTMICRNQNGDIDSVGFYFGVPTSNY